MAETAIEIPDYVTVVKPVPVRSIAGLANLTAILLSENADLPAPHYFHVSQTSQDARFGFGNSADSFWALAQWAERFGGTVTAEPYTRDDGQQSIHCQVTFIHEGVEVEAYAFITTDEAATAT